MGCLGCTASVTGPARAKIASVSILQVGEAVGDFRDGMSSQRCSRITDIFIPSRNALLPIRPRGIIDR